MVEQLEVLGGRKTPNPPITNPVEEQRPVFLGQPTVHLNLDVANLGDRHMAALHLEGCGREYQTAKTVAPFESRESGCLVFLDATKEVLKCAVKTNQYRLQRMRVNTLELRAHFLDGRQLGLLL